MAVITFFGNVLELNEITAETFQGRPTKDFNNAAIAERFRMMALNLEQALDGLNSCERFRIAEDYDLTQLFTPSGIAVAQMKQPPRLYKDCLPRSEAAMLKKDSRIPIRD